MPQFVCPIDGEGFDQRSRYERHMAAAHPTPALSAADLEHAIAGIDFPKHKAELIDYAARRLPPDSELLHALRALPEGLYRDAAEVGMGFGATKRPAGAVFTAEEPPSVRGGRSAATRAVSAASVAKLLGGVDFPASRSQLRAHSERNRSKVSDPDQVLAILDRLPERLYTSMAAVEEEVGRIL